MNNLPIAKTEGDIFWYYFKLRFAFFLKEESKFFWGIVFTNQLLYTIIFLVQMNSGHAETIMFDLSTILLPILWVYTASSIFSRERMASRNILTLTTPINPYHRFTINAFISILLLPIASLLITRIVYAINIGIAAVFIPNKTVLNEYGIDVIVPNIYQALSLWDWIKTLFPPLLTTFKWFLPVTFFFMMATILRKFVFFKTLLILWLFHLILTIILLLFGLANIITETNIANIGSFFMSIFNFYKTYPILIYFSAITLGFGFLTIAYFRVKRFRTI